MADPPAADPPADDPPIADPRAAEVVDDLDDEDRTLVTLARSARARTGAPEGAALRDDIGRTYAAATVRLPSLQLSALQAAVAAAISSGSETVATLVLHTAASELTEGDAAVVADVAAQVVLLAAADGSVRRVR